MISIRPTASVIRALMVGTALFFAGQGVAMADVIYNSIPSPFPTNLPSLGYQATQTSEFGDEIIFAGNARNLTDVNITLSDWALYSQYGDQVTASYTSTAAGWTTPLTLNLYNVGVGNSVGSLIASQTINPTILWRPEASAGCGTGFGTSPDCYNGLAQNVTFNFTGTVVPDQIIYGLVFNTQSYGPSPTGASGPYNSLNFALNDTTGPSVGTDANSDALYWNTSTHSWYTAYDSLATAFQQDTNWSGYLPAAQFEAVPEPSTLALFGAGLLGFGFLGLRRRRKTGMAI